MKLQHSVYDRENGLFNNRFVDLRSLCTWLFPAISVDLYVQESSDEEAVLIVKANDWITLDAGTLFDRIYSEATDYRGLSTDFQAAREHFTRTERPLFKDGQRMVGRLAVDSLSSSQDRWVIEINQATICISGIRATGALEYRGIVLGQPSRAARDEAYLSATHEELRRWAEEQALILRYEDCRGQKDYLSAAEALRTLGAEAPDLPIGIHGRQLISPRSLRRWLENRSLVMLMDSSLLSVFEVDENNLSVRHRRTGIEVILNTEHVMLSMSSYCYLLGESNIQSLRPQYNEFDLDRQYSPRERRWRYGWWRICGSAMGDAVRIAGAAWGTDPTKLMERAEFGFQYDSAPVTFKIGTFPDGSSVEMPAVRLVRLGNS